MEGPYRDLGAGFARLLGAEGLRRSPGSLRSVEDALFELLRNSRDAGARNVYVASSLRARRYRTVVVIDDGRGIPETHKSLIFEPGVTTRHLEPVSEDTTDPPGQTRSPHGAGLSLYHIKSVALSAEVVSASSPTAIRAAFDIRTLPEKSLQSAGSRPSKTNLPATLSRFVTTTGPLPPRLYHASPAGILARLLKDRIIQDHERSEEVGRNARLVRESALGVGLEVSLRTVQRVLAGEVPAARRVDGCVEGAGGRDRSGRLRAGAERDELVGPILSLEAEDVAEISGVLRRAARSRYLEVAGLDIEKSPGEVVLRARVYEQEDEYE